MEEQVVIDHLPLADAIARKYGRRGPDLEDMVQVARMALLKAARRIEPQRNTGFGAFARPTIAGEVKRYLRDSAWMVQPPRGIQDLHTEVTREHPALCQLLGREPTLEELAEHLGEETEAVAEAIASHTSLQPDSLDKVTPAGLALEDRLPDRQGDVFGALDDSLALAQALRTLDGAEKELLRMRFFEDQSQQGIGDRLGMTQVQVSRALARILVKLQRHMLYRGEHDGATPGSGAAWFREARSA
jgi:RNA polymerase sigma-B factor